MILQTFKREFDMRHTFNNTDLLLLKERWPYIKIYNIPDAWILSIDEMIYRLRYNNPIKEIRQEFGQLIIIHEGLTEKQRQIINAAEKQIYNIDEDLNLQLSENKNELEN